MTPTDIGKLLREAREEQSKTIAQIAQSTHIKPHYLQALEDGEHDLLPSEAQVKGFLRSYSEYLGLDYSSLVSSHAKEDSENLEESLESPESSVIDEIPRSADIFLEVGEQLRNQRELLKFTFEDVEEHTHLKEHYITAIENGDIQSLPSPVQGRGMVHNYARFLGLDPDPILLLFAEGLQERRLENQKPAKTTSKGRKKKKRKFLSSLDTITGIFLIVILVGAISWGAMRVFSMRTDQTPTPTAPSIADVLLKTSVEITEPTPQQGTPVKPVISIPGTEEVTPTPTGDFTSGDSDSKGSIRIYITVHHRAWMRVTVDGKIDFDGRVLPGSAYTFAGDEEISILTGNGGALQVYYNENDYGLLGYTGQLVSQVFTVEGVQTPTPLPTNTPGPTETPFPTPIPAGT